MVIDEDIAKFVRAIGAMEPSPGDKNHQKWRGIFRRSNYFIFNNKFMIVKISRSKKPFWGLNKKIIDLFDSLDDYYIVLLCSPNEGWLFNKSEVKQFIDNEKWKLRKNDNNYKINYPLPDDNSFYSINKFVPLLPNTLDMPLPMYDPNTYDKMYAELKPLNVAFTNRDPQKGNFRQVIMPNDDDDLIKKVQDIINKYLDC